MDEIKSHDFTTNGMAPKTQSFKADVTGYVLYFLDKKQTVNTEIEFHFEKAAPDFTDKSTKPFVVHMNSKAFGKQTHLRLDLNKSFSFWFTLFIIFVVMYMLEEKGLVLEGGGFRGMYTCGDNDVFMENTLILTRLLEFLQVLPLAATSNLNRLEELCATTSVFVEIQDIQD